MSDAPPPEPTTTTTSAPAAPTAVIPPVPPPSTDPSEYVKIRVADASGTEIYFKVKRKTKFQKITDAYSKRNGMVPGSVRFTFDGNRIRMDDTVGSLELENGDVIDAMVEQTGGGRVVHMVRRRDPQAAPSLECDPTFVADDVIPGDEERGREDDVIPGDEEREWEEAFKARCRQFHEREMEKFLAEGRVKRAGDRSGDDTEPALKRQKRM